MTTVAKLIKILETMGQDLPVVVYSAGETFDPQLVFEQRTEDGVMSVFLDIEQSMTDGKNPLDAIPE